jgi:hypothetical protein
MAYSEETLKSNDAKAVMTLGYLLTQFQRLDIFGTADTDGIEQEVETVLGGMAPKSRSQEQNRICPV